MTGVGMENNVCWVSRSREGGAGQGAEQGGMQGSAEGRVTEKQRHWMNFVLLPWLGGAIL